MTNNTMTISPSATPRTPKTPGFYWFTGTGLWDKEWKLVEVFRPCWENPDRQDLRWRYLDKSGGEDSASDVATCAGEWSDQVRYDRTLETELAAAKCESITHKDLWGKVSDELSEAMRELAAAKELLREIRDNEVNASDEADKFLRDHQPSELARLRAELERERKERTDNNSLLVGQRNTAEADLAEANSHLGTLRAALVEIASFTHEPQASAVATRALKLTQPWEDDDAKQP